MTRASSQALTLLLGVGAVSAACSLQNFDYLESGLTAGGRGGSAGHASAGKNSGGSASTGGSGSSASASSGGDAGNGDAGSPDGGAATSGGKSAGGTAGSANGGGGTNGGGGSSAGGANGGGGVGGAPIGPPIVIGPFNFDSATDITAWQPNESYATTSWVQQGMSPPLGALAVTVTQQSEVTHAIDTSDLRGRVATFRVRTESGSTGVKPFAFSTGYAWSDGGERPVSTDWVTVQISFDSPAYTGVGFDPAQIIGFGIQVTTVSTVWIDSVTFN